MTGFHKIFNYDKGPSQKSPVFKHRNYVFYTIFWKRHLFPFHLPMKHIIEATFLVNYTSSTYEESGFWFFEIKLLKFENFLGAQKWVGAQMSRGPNGSGPKWVGAQMCWGPNESGPKCAGAQMSWGPNVLGPKWVRGPNEEWAQMCPSPEILAIFLLRFWKINVFKNLFWD